MPEKQAPKPAAVAAPQRERGGRGAAADGVHEREAGDRPAKAQWMDGWRREDG
uniref:Uncharacterized protein n=1 Tax=Oryza sativa subsp. japonica TaxID=39947 RepID=Q9AV19_ORYSJ|nr:hypothetical protein [Oryza sativa Japonica Group]